MGLTVSSEMLKRWLNEGPALAPPHRLSLLCAVTPAPAPRCWNRFSILIRTSFQPKRPTYFADYAIAPLKRNLSPDANLLAVLEAASIPLLQQSREAYFHAMDLCLGGPVANRLLLDKHPMLTFMIPAFIRVFPEARFLIALRDPRDVVLSRFMQTLRPTPINVAFLSLEGTTEDYVVIMGLWRKLAPLMPASWLEIRYEDMVEDLESVARKTLDFLGVPWDARVLGFDEHARQRVVRSAAYADVTQPVYKRAVGHWRNYQKYLEPHLEKLEPFVKAFGYD